MTAHFLSIVGAVRGRRPRLQEILMRRWIQVCAIALTVTAGFALPQAPGTGGRSIQGRSPAPPAPGPLVNLFFINRQMTATPKRKMSVHDVATGTWGDTAWAAFAYTIDDGRNKRIGINTTLFRKSGNDWKIVLIHGSINAPAVPH